MAAFIVEPVQGKGVNIPSPGYLLQASRLCRKYGALFVADEVQSGMGRNTVSLRHPAAWVHAGIRAVCLGLALGWQAG